MQPQVSSMASTFITSAATFRLHAFWRMIRRLIEEKSDGYRF